MEHLRRRAPLIAGLLLLACSLTSCSASDQPSRQQESDPEASAAPAPISPSKYQVPDNIRNATIVWSAESGIDLLGEEATVIRAALEAHHITLGSPISDSYPGYARAIDQETKDFYNRYTTQSAWEYGTGYRRIRNIEPTDNGFIAYTCQQLSGIASRQPDGKFRQTITGGNSEVSLTMERREEYAPATSSSSPGTSAATPTVDEAGRPHWQAPSRDAFVGWNVIFNGPVDSDHDRACREWARQFIGEAPEGVTRIVTDDPPETLPAYPGW